MPSKIPHKQPPEMPFSQMSDSTRRLNILIAQVRSNSDADISKE